jgi:L-threonylcarbamoyladenylate synthase
MAPHCPRILSTRPDPEAAVRAAAAALRAGRLVVLPTDTVYGVAADPRAPGGEERLCAAKGRDRDKPIPLLAADLAAVEAGGALLRGPERRLAGRFWPGPLTLVLDVRGAARRTEGFRVPACGVALALLRAAGGVLRVTSANMSGEPPALTAGAAAAALGAAVDLVLDAGPAPGGIASTVARVEDGRLRILRQGALAPEELEACLRD